jgi:hypothetical protein
MIGHRLNVSFFIILLSPAEKNHTIHPVQECPADIPPPVRMRAEVPFE